MPPSQRKAYCLTIIHRSTRWPEAISISDITAELKAKELISGWIANFGIPLRVTTDLGRKFELIFESFYSSN